MFDANPHLDLPRRPTEVRRRTTEEEGLEIGTKIRAVGALFEISTRGRAGARRAQCRNAEEPKELFRALFHIRPRQEARAGVRSDACAVFGASGAQELPERARCDKAKEKWAGTKQAHYPEPGWSPMPLT